MRDLSRPRNTAAPVLQVSNLNIYYGRSHALQGVDLTHHHGVLSVVGRNGMGKTTLCQAIMGLVPVASGSIRFEGEELVGLNPSQISRHGLGYVPQGRRLWPSLTVDEHLRLAAGMHKGPWSVERVYDTFPRLGERRNNGGGQLSGGEQQMLTIARALLLNPRLLIMDEPTEGLAPVIVELVEDMLLRLADDGEVDVLVIEQNIGVATSISQEVAIMVNGRVNRVMPAATLAADRDLQQRLLGVGRHSHDETDAAAHHEADGEGGEAATPSRGATRLIYNSNPKVPTRWTPAVPVARIEAAARTDSNAGFTSTVDMPSASVELRPLSASGEEVVLIAGTLDTKGRELRYLRDLMRDEGVRARLVDLSTSGDHAPADISAREIAVYHRGGPGAVFTGDRGSSVAAMAQAFEAWTKRQAGIAGIISAGGSGAAAMVAPAMRTLPVGVPKLIVSTVASGNVQQYVGPTDITMMHSVADIQGLNRITRDVLANAAAAMAGMVRARRERTRREQTEERGTGLRAVGLTMFGVTTKCVQQITGALEGIYDCLVFHATGIGGQSMEKLVDSGMLSGVIDVTTTEVCDLLMGGVFPAHEDRFGAMIRARMPYVGACGALDMVNFGARDTVPQQYQGRTLYEHNPQVTLMRTTAEENRRIGQWIGERLNRMDAPVRFFLPEGGVSALDAPGQPFHDPAADAALFEALEQTVRQSTSRRLIRVPHNVNDPEFSAAVVEAFYGLHGGPVASRRRARR